MKRGVYRHYKGKTYRVLFVARHSETMEDMVVYEPLYESAVRYWVRPLNMFSEMVEVDGKQMPRFEYISQK